MQEQRSYNRNTELAKGHLSEMSEGEVGERNPRILRQLRASHCTILHRVKPRECERAWSFCPPILDSELSGTHMPAGG